MNAAIPGADTKIEFRELQESKTAAQILILSYYPNDIQQAGKDAGIPLVVEEPYDGLNTVLSYLIRHSFFLNYLYWYTPVHNDLGGYEEFLAECYQDPKALSIHRHDLENIFSHAGIKHT